MIEEYANRQCARRGHAALFFLPYDQNERDVCGENVFLLFFDSFSP